MRWIVDMLRMAMPATVTMTKKSIDMPRMLPRRFLRGVIIVSPDLTVVMQFLLSYH